MNQIHVLIPICDFEQTQPFLWPGMQWSRQLQRCKRWKVTQIITINITEELIKPEGVSLFTVTRQDRNWIDWMFFLVTVCLSGLQCVVVTLHLLLVPQNLPNIPHFPHRLHFHNSRAQLDLQWRVHLSWYCQWRCIGPLLNKSFLNSLYNSCFRSNRLDNRLTRGIKKTFLWSKSSYYCKNAYLWDKKWQFRWPNHDSKTTFIVQTFLKYGLCGFYFMTLSLLGTILAKFKYWWFLGSFIAVRR